MSIPPLVCSTPPPLDQCADDKDIEEFDLRYRLSQEEDEDNEDYNYGNFSTCTGFTEDISVKESPKHDVKTDTVLENIDLNKTETSSINSPGKDIIKSKYDDVAIEDLNLNIEQDNILAENLTDVLNNVDESDSYGITCFVNHSDSPDKNILSDNSILVTKSNEEDKVDEINISETNSLNTEVKEETSTAVLHKELYEDIKSDIIYNNEDVTPNTLEHSKSDPEVRIQDNFDDFEDFQFTSPIVSSYEVIENDGNPWESRNSEDTSFGDFKANFDNGETPNLSNEVLTDKQIMRENVNAETPSEVENIDDDFGDFDDFKSSAKEESVEKTLEEQISPHVNVLNLQCSDNEAQVIESINNILFNIFTVDLPNTDSVFEGSLELSLSETWHHLKEVDERQPYIVYWNNSLGQKTLLKALCIDSRNILFGPKWNYFMPKYATNLSVAPIKPQKPTQTPEAPQQTDASNSEKINKENTTWADPFTSNGQEYTYAEALLLDLEHLMATLDQMAHKQSTLKISELLSNANNTDREKASKETRPAELDVFENTVSVTNIDKILASTLSVQPVRHINLPDTHIFTPTDSETPRSKTIHYDNRPPVLIPQQILENHVNLEKSMPKHTDLENNDDYWEFQDFKGVSGAPYQTTESIKSDKEIEVGNSSLINSGITYQNQILQPVKLEPIMPTLNWPDPGEVKETFDDFSEFISSSSWNDSPNVTDTKSVLPTSAIESKSMPCQNNVDDEFETFQSGPATNNIKLDSPDNTQIKTCILNQFDAVNNLHKQVENLNLKTNESVSQSHTQNSSMKNSPMSVLPRPDPKLNILQPSHAGPSNAARPQQCGQILQPLSLESYSQINWPKPGIDLQNLSSFNPLESLQALKSDSSSSGASKGPSPVHNKVSTAQNDISEDDIWGDFVSSNPKQIASKKSPVFADDDEWTDFVSSPSISQISLNTISLNVQTNSNMQKNTNQNVSSKNNQMPLEMPALNYITPKSNSHGVYIDKHFQNL